MLTRKASPDSPPMFESAFFDQFSRTHYLTVPVLFVPATVALLVQSGLRSGFPVLAQVGLFALGVLAWTFAEYWLHRTLFHWVPKAGWGARFHFFLHGVHHLWPHDRFRLVMPPAVSIGLFFAFLGLWIACMGAAGWVFHAGFTAGYMLYDLTHYAIHHASFRGRRFQKLRRHHLTHHFKKGFQGKFGVSTTLWDHVFGTFDATPSAASGADVGVRAG